MSLKKGLIGIVLAMTLIVQTLSLNFVAYAGSFTLESVAREGSNFIFAFSENIGAGYADKFTVTNLVGVSQTDITVSVAANVATVTLGSSFVYGDTNPYFIAVDGSLSSELSDTLGANKKYQFYLNGYQKSFGTGLTNTDWIYRTIATNATTNYLSTVNEMGRLTDNTTGVAYPVQPTFAYKNNYSSYNLGNTTTEFDYMRTENCPTTPTDYGYANVFSAFTRFSGFNVVASAAKYNGYFFESTYNGRVLKLRKVALGADGTTMNYTPLVAIAGTITNTQLHLLANIKYKFKMITTDVPTGVNIKIYRATYTNDVLGEYVSLCDYTDTNAPLTSGGSAFLGGSNAYGGPSDTAVNNHYIDNILYAQNSFEASKTNSDIISEWATAKSQINLVTLGGSITEGGGWTTAVSNYLATASGKTVNLFNAGFGGTGSEYGNLRLYDDVISKNPDVVFIDYAVNDFPSWATMNGKRNYMTSVETLVRRLKSLQNPPMIFFAHFTIESMLKADAAFENNATYYVSGNNVSGPLPKDDFNLVASYYGIPVIDVHDYLEQFVTVSPDYSTLTVDYGTTVANALTPYVSDYINNNNNITYGVNYTYAQAIAEGSIKAILPDTLHANAIGKAIYGDFIVGKLTNDFNCQFKNVAIKVAPLTGPAYEKFSPKKILVTNEWLTNNPAVTITGNPTIADITPSLVGQIPQKGVTVTTTEPTTITYKFRGHIFSTRDIKPAGTAVLVDDVTPSFYGTDLQLRRMLSQDNEHTVQITIPAGANYTLREIFLDEENFISNKHIVEYKTNKILPIDISFYANAQGGYYIAEKNVRPFLSGNTELINWQGVNMDNVIENMDSEGFLWNPTAGGGMAASTGVYDFTSAKNYRYRMISNIGTLSNSEYAIGKSKSIVPLGNVSGSAVKFAAICTASADYPIIINYTDGTFETKLVDLSVTTTDLTADGSPTYIKNFDSFSSSWAQGWGGKLMEYTVATNPAKKLKSIDFTRPIGNTATFTVAGVAVVVSDQVGIYDLGLIDTAKNSLISNAASYAGQQVGLKYSLYNNTNSEKNVVVISAIYSDEAKSTLVGTLYNTFTVPAGTWLSNANATITLPDNLPVGFVINSYVWGGLDGISPLSVSYSEY